MVSSAPTILRPQVRIPSTPSRLFSICIIEIVMSLYFAFLITPRLNQMKQSIIYYFSNEPFPTSFSTLFLFDKLTVNNNCLWLNSEDVSLVSQATNLPAVSQPLTAITHLTIASPRTGFEPTACSNLWTFLRSKFYIFSGISCPRCSSPRWVVEAPRQPEVHLSLVRWNSIWWYLRSYQKTSDCEMP